MEKIRIRDTGSKKVRSGINIPDLQYCKKMLPMFKIFRDGFKAYFD